MAMATTTLALVLATFVGVVLHVLLKFPQEEGTLPPEGRYRRLYFPRMRSDLAAFVTDLRKLATWN